MHDDHGAPLALSMGEPAGIGPDIVLLSWLRSRDGQNSFVCIGDQAVLAERAAAMKLAVPLAAVNSAEEAPGVFSDALPVLHQPLPRPVRPGVLNPANGGGVISAIETAVSLTRLGHCRAVVTCPIHKKNLYEAGFTFPGHTEFLASLAAEKEKKPPRPVMMLACAALRVIPVTIHIALADVPAALTGKLIRDTARIAARDMKTRFGMAAPRLAIAGLNPHAGEGGAMGHEEETIIAPAIAELKAEGLDVSGPLPADTMFHAEARARYDVALAMYHDQALIPIKTLDFEHGVNVTLGLPFVRTSPDHGTALEIAGSGRASPASLLAALDMAALMSRGGRA